LDVQGLNGIKSLNLNCHLIAIGVESTWMKMFWLQ
jgi:hypothetical protein